MPTNTRRSFLKVSGAVLGGIATGTTVTAAERTDRFIVKTKGNNLPTDLAIVHELPGVNYAVVRGTESDVKSAKRVNQHAPDIELELDLPAEPVDAPTVEDESITDEPLYPLQWDKQVLDVETAHETTKGEGTRVSVIDSGVAAGHPDLDVNEALSQNFTGDGLGSANPAGGFHGTHVGGIVAAQTEPEVGVGGSAPDTDLVDCRVFSASGAAAFGDVLAAVLYSAAIDADVANLSIGAYPVPRQGLGSFYGGSLNTVFTYANKQGTLLTVSAGNDAADLQHDKGVISIPNEVAQAMSISATGPIGFAWGDPGLEAPFRTPAGYTNYGTNAIDIAAPGGNAIPEGDQEDSINWHRDLILNTIALPVYETDEDGNPIGIEDVIYNWAWVSGTSMAAPQVAGAAALVKSVNPDYNANQVESALERAAAVPDGFGKEFYGSGFLNIVDAL